MRASPIALVLFLPVAVAALPAPSSRTTSEQAKIDWLLARMRNSNASFLRNGKTYDGRKASSHLKRKLSFAGGRVKTARDFILGVASRSEETGRPYEVLFGDGRKKPLGEWLNELLAHLEKRQEGASTAAPGESGAPRPRESAQ